MEQVFEKNFDIRTYEVDMEGRVRPTALLNYLQEAAEEHSRLLGVAVRDIMPKGLTWVLSRTHLKCVGVARSRDQIRIRTWPSAREGRFTCREFELSVADGRPIAIATCSFAVLDIARRRPVLLDDCLPDYPILPRRALEDDFATLPRLSDAETELTFRVGMGDIDINRHANNVAYAGWALETVPVEVAQGMMLVDLEIAYRAEIFYGETVVARCRRIGDGMAPTFLHQLVRGDGIELTRLVSRWRKDDVPTGRQLESGR